MQAQIYQKNTNIENPDLKQEYSPQIGGGSNLEKTYSNSDWQNTTEIQGYT